MAMVELAHRKMPVYDDAERHTRFELMWSDARAAAAAGDASDDRPEPTPPDVGALLDADPTEPAWWWR